MKSFFWALAAGATVFAFAACGLTKGKEIGEKAVTTFHEQFNDSKFADIYTTATPAFRASATEADYLKFIQAVRRKLGVFRSGTQSGWRTNATTGGTFVMLSYKSKFEKGSAVETFTFLISGSTAALQNYNINSPTLVAD